ncbi:MAG TPA: DMT family transporter [Candidatus Deferrimicrobiaceae bacterium]|nr:DMT family transporter [Candidatus Deferrimicrobiaceae bacterium]
MIARPARSDWLLLIVLGLMWGTSYAFIKLGIETLSTFTLIASRLGIGLLLLLVVVRLAREPLPRQPRTYVHLVVMAVVNIVIPFTLITFAEQSVESALAAVLNGAVPLVTIVVAALFLHDEPITVNRLVGLVVGYGGVIILVSRGLTGLGGDDALVGEIALLGSTVSYGVGAVYSRRNIRGLRPMIPALFQVLFAFLIVTVLALVFERPLDVRWNADAVVAIVWLGLLSSGLAYLVFFRLLSRVGATRTSLVAYLLPVVGIVSGALMFGEQVDARILFGTALVIGGVALVNSRFGERRLFGRRAPDAAPD